MTLPLSYSRLRSLSWGASPRQTPLRALSLAAPPARRSGGQARSLRSNHPAVDWRKSFDSALRASLRTFASAENGPSMNEARRAESNGGEGRIRTSEAARATDLQSAAFDRFATSPILRPHLARPPTRAGRDGMACSTFALRATADKDGRRHVFPQNCLDFRCSRLPLRTAGPKSPVVLYILELAKGFEPPTG